jgi:hypothetical protein
VSHLESEYNIKKLVFGQGFKVGDTLQSSLDEAKQLVIVPVNMAL